MELGLGYTVTENSKLLAGSFLREHSVRRCPIFVSVVVGLHQPHSVTVSADVLRPDASAFIQASAFTDETPTRCASYPRQIRGALFISRAPRVRFLWCTAAAGLRVRLVVRVFVFILARGGWAPCTPGLRCTRYAAALPSVGELYHVDVTGGEL